MADPVNVSNGILIIADLSHPDLSHSVPGWTNLSLNSWHTNNGMILEPVQWK